MKKLNIEPTKDSLAIKYNDGVLKMHGKSLLPNPRKFFDPVFQWVDAYVQDPDDSLEISLNFEYIDTASVQAVFDVLNKLKKELPDAKEKVLVKWHFEFDDPELLELGEIMEGRLGLKFNYVEYDDFED